MTKAEDGAALFRTRAGRDALTLATMFRRKGERSSSMETAYVDILTIARSPGASRIYEDDAAGAFVALAKARMHSALHGTDPYAVIDALSGSLDATRESLMIARMLRARVPDIAMFADTLPEDGTACLLSWVDGETIHSLGVRYAAETDDFFHPEMPAQRLRVAQNSDGSVSVRDLTTQTAFPGMVRKIADPEPRPAPETDSTDPRP